MPDLINLDILTNPINWLIVTLVLIFIAYSVYAIGLNAQGFIPPLPENLEAI